MMCAYYLSCKKERACTILGQCVFTHDLVMEAPAQAKLNIHYAKRVGAIVNVFQKIKSGKPFNGAEISAQYHMVKIGLKPLIGKRTWGEIWQQIESEPEINFHE